VSLSSPRGGLQVDVVTSARAPEALARRRHELAVAESLRAARLACRVSKLASQRAARRRSSASRSRSIWVGVVLERTVTSCASRRRRAERASSRRFFPILRSGQSRARSTDTSTSSPECASSLTALPAAAPTSPSIHPPPLRQRSSCHTSQRRVVRLTAATAAAATRASSSGARVGRTSRRAAGRRQQPAAAQHERYDADDHARRLAADEHARPIGRMGGYGGRGARLARGSAGVSATVRPLIVCIERVRDRHGPACPHRPRISRGGLRHV